MLLLMLLMLIIEVARIFQAYVTLQGAARAGARYAITGQWDPAYAGTTDPDSSNPADVTAAIAAMSSGWNPTSADPLKHIPPCWPRFQDRTENNGVDGSIVYYSQADYPYAPYNAVQAGGITYDEPYRSPRTCSIEATVIRSLAGLNLDPINIGNGGLGPKVTDGVGTLSVCCSLDFNDTPKTLTGHGWDPYHAGTVPGHPLNAPYTYSIEILGYSAEAAYPITGGYGHPDWTDETQWDDLSFEGNIDSSSDYFKSANHDPGISRGFGGDPGQQVTVRVTYRFGLITPIFSRIIPTFNLTGTATMINEMWGSTGVQSKAVLPPPTSPLPPPTPTPPNLVVTSITGPTTNVSPTPYQPTYTVVVTNTGGTDITTASFPVTLWASDHPITDITTLMPDSFLQEAPSGSVVKFGTATVNTTVTPLSANGGSTTVTVQGSFPAALPGNKPWTLYPVVDSYDTTPAPGAQDGAIDEADITATPPNWAQEQDNVGTPLSVTVTTVADLQTFVKPDQTSHAFGDSASFTVVVQNNGTGNTTGPTSVQISTNIASLISSNLVAMNGSPSVNSGTYVGSVWNVGPLASGAQATLTFPVKVTTNTNNTAVALKIMSYTQVDLGFTDPTSSNNPMGCTAPVGTDDCKTGTFIVNGVNLNLSKTVDNSTPIEGSNHPFTYTLTTVNQSTTTDAQNVTIYDALPIGETFLANGASGSNTSSACTVFVGTLPPEVQSGLSGYLVSGQTIVACSMGTVARSNGTAVAKISVYANAGTGGQTLYNAAYSTTTGTDTNPKDNSALKVAVTIQSVAISVVKTALPKYMVPGTTNSFTWTITVTNKGPNDATNVVIQDSIPTASLASYTVNTPSGTSYTAPNWTITSLPKNTSVQMTIVAKPKTSLTNGTTIVNTAKYISADQTNSDKNAADLSSTSTVTMDNKTEADIQIIKTVSPTSAKPGDTVTYTFTVLNNGPVSASNIVLTDTTLQTSTDPSIPSVSPSTFFDYSGGTPPGWWNATTGQNGTPFTLAAGATQTFTMPLKVNGNLLIPNFTNDATVTSGLPDQDTTNNDDEATLNVVFPGLVFTNAGGTGCTTDTWGDEVTGIPIFPTHIFVPSQPYAALTWGFQGTYTSNPPTTFNFIDYTTPTPQPISSDGQNLMNCTVTGRNFSFRVDNMLPGLYQIALIFADPTNVAGTHRFNVTAVTNRGRVARLLSNFDINLTIQANSGLTPISGNNVHYLVDYAYYRVKNGGGGSKNFLRLHFFYGRRSKTYTNTSAMISGVGVTFVTP